MSIEIQQNPYQIPSFQSERFKQEDERSQKDIICVSQQKDLSRRNNSK